MFSLLELPVPVKKASKTIPIVFVITQDPVAAEYLDSLARPAGKITGLTSFTRDLSENGWNC